MKDSVTPTVTIQATSSSTLKHGNATAATVTAARSAPPSSVSSPAQTPTVAADIVPSAFWGFVSNITAAVNDIRSELMEVASVASTTSSAPPTPTSASSTDERHRSLSRSSQPTDAEWSAALTDFSHGLEHIGDTLFDTTVHWLGIAQTSPQVETEAESNAQTSYAVDISSPATIVRDRGVYESDPADPDFASYIHAFKHDYISKWRADCQELLDKDPDMRRIFDELVPQHVSECRFFARLTFHRLKSRIISPPPSQSAHSSPTASHTTKHETSRSGDRHSNANTDLSPLTSPSQAATTTMIKTQPALYVDSKPLKPIAPTNSAAQSVPSKHSAAVPLSRLPQHQVPTTSPLLEVAEVYRSISQPPFATPPRQHKRSSPKRSNDKDQSVRVVSSYTATITDVVNTPLTRSQYSNPDFAHLSLDTQDSTAQQDVRSVDVDDEWVNIQPANKRI